jgi:hypothetical protein
MEDDRWAETERGTVQRRYFHAAGASRELQMAQERGWKVREATLNGQPVPENPKRKWLRLPPTRLVRNAKGRVELKAGAGGGGDWHVQGRNANAFDLIVTYERTDEARTG